MSIKPLHDRILVERLEAESKSAGGIIIPDNAKEKPQKGRVIEVGSGARDENGKKVPLELKKGDVVLFAKWGGTEINFNGKELLIMKESDILAVLDGEHAATKSKGSKAA